MRSVFVSVITKFYLFIFLTSAAETPLANMTKRGIFNLLCSMKYNTLLSN